MRTYLPQWTVRGVYYVPDKKVPAYEYTNSAAQRKQSKVKLPKQI